MFAAAGLVFVAALGGPHARAPEPVTRERAIVDATTQISFGSALVVVGGLTVLGGGVSALAVASLGDTAGGQVFLVPLGALLLGGVELGIGIPLLFVGRGDLEEETAKGVRRVKAVPRPADGAPVEPVTRHPESWDEGWAPSTETPTPE